MSKKTSHQNFGNHFKAKVALEAINKNDIQTLTKKYSLSEDTINIWVQQLKEKAEFIFIEEEDAEKPQITHDYAELLKVSLDTSPNGIVITDLQGNVIIYNKRSVEMWDAPADLVNKGQLETMMPYILSQVKNPEAFKETVEKTYLNPESHSNETIAFKDGRFFERNSVPYYVGGQVVGRVTNFVDITRYKKTERKLSKFGNLIHSINTNVNEGILRSTPDKGLVYVNKAFVEIFGYSSKEEVLATDPAQFYADETIRQKLVQKLKDEKQFNNEEVLFKRKNGSTFWGLENSILADEKGDLYIDAVVTDIDNWKGAERALRKSEQKYRKILKNIEEGYFEMNLAGDFTFFNSMLVEMMGYPAEQMMGMNNQQYMDEKNAQKVYQTFNRVYRTGISEHRFDWELICGDGSRIYVEASVTLRRDSNDQPIGFSGIIRNITERKRKSKQIRDSLKEKEALLGEIHHRVKNNLAVISGLLYLQADKTDDPGAYRALMQSQNRINSMALIHELLYDNRTFSSLDPRVYIEQLVQNVSSNLSTDHTKIQTKIEAQSFNLEMSTAIPCALIINELITNAYKYAFKDQDEGVVEIIFREKEDGYYHLEVSDNGCGLPPGFDLQDSSQHGLGLSLVKTLTRQIQGNIHTPDKKGACFVITFAR